MRALGHVVAARGALLEASLPAARIGGGVRIGALAARVVALRDGRAVLAPFGSAAGIAHGTRVRADDGVLALPLGTALLGRAIAPCGAPLDGEPPAAGKPVRCDAAALPPRDRRPCSSVLWTGVRAVDGALTLARGARVGIFGAPGAGKSTLLESIARHVAADAVVIALIGERGREAERWLACRDERTTIVCATSDRSAAERVRAAEVAFAQADALRARGLDVLLLVDSLARVCAAQRELALAAGEPAGRGGYPAGVFALLGRLLERAGSFACGTVSVLATVLSEGPDEGDPVAEAARAALDGHLVLSRRLAQAGRFPAIDLPRSASRTATSCTSPEHASAARKLRAAAGLLADSADARALGLHPEQADPALGRAAAAESAIECFLRQDGAASSPHQTLTALVTLADTL